MKEKRDKIINNLKDMEISISSSIDSLYERLAEIQEEYNKAIEEGDARENASLEKAEKDLAECSDDIKRFTTQLTDIHIALDELKNYVPINIVIPYSTVELEQTSNKGNKIFTVMLLKSKYICDVDKGLLSMASLLGMQLRKKEVGNIITITSTSNKYVYKIKEVY